MSYEGARFAICSLLASILIAAMPVNGQTTAFLIVTRSAKGWEFQDAETLIVNGKDKLRTAPLPGGNYDSKTIGRLAQVQLSGFTIVRRTAEGLVLARAGQGEWQLLLPEGNNPKTATSAAQLWGAATIGFKKDRKDKSLAGVRPEDLFAIIPGRDSAESAAWLATEISAYKTPGVDDPEAFRQMLTILPAAAKTFHENPAAKTISDFLSSAILKRLQRWQEGDAPESVLEESLALAAAADAAFPGDKELTDLSTLARAARKALDRKLAILRALDAGRQSDAFLIAYRNFEIYDKSFPEISKARAAHMEASAEAHVRAAQSLQASGDYMGAIRHLLIAKWRDPKLKSTDDLLERVRLEAARLSVQKFAETRRGIDPRSPEQVQLQRKLLLAEQQMNDGKMEDAEKTLKDAEGMDKDEPRITLLQARLSVARGDLGKALALLDNFDGIAITAQDFAEGEKLRASVQYTIDNSLSKKRAEIEQDLNQQRFAAALEGSAEGLKLDNENPEFLYFAAANACVLRNCGTAAAMLHRYLDVTDSAQGNRERRLMAMQLYRESLVSAENPKAEVKSDEKSWFSGAPLEHGVMYDPVSLSFQAKVTRIEASDHLNISYEWSGAQLESVHAKHEEKQTGGNIARLAGAAAASAAGMSTTLNWKTAARETNDFFFNYYDDAPQILKVSREKTRVESRRVPISIPGIGIFGPFAGIGALGAIGNLGAISKLGGLGGLSGGGGLGGLGGMPGLSSLGLGGGIGGAGNSAILSRLAGSGRMSGISGFSSLSTSKPLIPSKNYSVLPDPQGGSSEGYLSLWNNPRLDTRLAFKVTGKRAAVGFSGNKYFHPFAWDAIHLFELDYDEQGRVLHAWELDSPGAPRIDFTWDGQRLMRVAARDDSGAVVYSRTLNYSGDRLTSENISGQGGSSKIEYKYDKQGHLIEAVADADKTLDGRSRKIFFLDEDKGKH